MSRLVALVALTAAFVPAAVMGALPVVAPVVGLVMVLLRLIQVPDEAELVPIAAESRSLG